MTDERRFSVGDPVRVEMSVKRYGGKPGFVVTVNADGGPLLEPVTDAIPLGDRDDLPRHPEYGVVLTIHRPQWRKDSPGSLSYDGDALKWFAPHELEARS